jgi:hypothetical protein
MGFDVCVHDGYRLDEINVNGLWNANARSMVSVLLLLLLLRCC